ncbi:beta-glucosidase BglX [bacterium]|nr:MAG: beta-glucosidase BglX [bacterium]
MDSKQIDARVKALLKKMTLEEKLGQLSQFSNGNATGPDNVRVDQNVLAARGGIGSILNYSGAKGTNELQRQAVEKSRLKIPILFGMDVIHGYRTVYPVPLGLASSWNPTIAEQCARMAAIEASSEGIRWTFSPMVDIARDARWGRITEGNGEDTYLGEVMAAAWVRGYQGNDLTDPTAMLACAKHYVAYGGAEGGREYNTVDMSERSLRDVYLPPFKATVDAGAGTFMSAFNTLGGVPTSANHHTLTDILRGEWGFRGFVVSDWNSVGELVAHGIALDGSDAAFKALSAGVDMDMSSNLYNTKGEDLVKSGRLKMSVVDTAVERVLRLKFALGLFEKPYTDETRSAKALLTPDHLALTRQAAEESFVLLKNAEVQNKPLLPLSADKKVALIGPLADSRGDMMGAWNTRGSGQDVVTLRQALSERLKDKLVYAKGTDIRGNEADFEAALAAAGQADVVVMALGEASGMSGEAASRTELGLPGRQLELLKAVVAIGKPVVLVLFNGRPLALPWEAEHVPAILEAWFPGTQAGPAVARTLYGEVNPTGKLTVSFPRSVGQMPLYYNNFNTGRPSKAPDKVGDGYSSAYLDQANSALFPFGWGLSYTRFDYSPTLISTPKSSATGLNKTDTIKVEALVKNTGSQSGSEIVQLYIRQRGNSVARPVRELKGFQKINLTPREVRRVQFTLSKKELAFWNIDMKNIVEPGELTVWVAPNSEAGQPAMTMISP